MDQVVSVGPSESLYGSEGWGFESLRARLRARLCPEFRHLRARLAKNQLATQYPHFRDRGSVPRPYIRPTFALMAWGTGTMRERSPGSWEIRVAVGVDPVSGRTVQRSFAFHGGAEEAELRRKELMAEWAERRAVRRAAPFLTVGELLERWLAAHHDWRPATWISARSNAKALCADGLAARRVSTLKPEHVRAAMAVWSTAGASVAVISGRFRVLRSAVGWAHVEPIIDVNPLSGMRDHSGRALGYI